MNDTTTANENALHFTTPRFRSISTDVSHDDRIECLSLWGAMSLALYLMARPHADDRGTLPGEPGAFRKLVCPMFTITNAEVGAAIRDMEFCELLQRYTENGRVRLATADGDRFARDGEQYAVLMATVGVVNDNRTEEWLNIISGGASREGQSWQQIA